MQVLENYIDRHGESWKKDGIFVQIAVRIVIIGG